MSLAYGCNMAVKIQLILAETDDLSAPLLITELSVAAYSLCMWSVHISAQEEQRDLYRSLTLTTYLPPVPEYKNAVKYFKQNGRHS